MKLIAQGAEAKLYRTDTHLIKERIKKNYRINEIDEKIRKYRNRRERDILERASKIIPVPKVLNYDEKNFKIDMEFIEGERLSDFLDKYNDKKRRFVCRMIGKHVALLHNKDIIHGDLTTSNMIIRNSSLSTLESSPPLNSLSTLKLYFIDFGLGFISNKVEDKAVDLHLLRQALESRHYRHYEDSYKEVLEGYKECSNYKEVLNRLLKVEKRGRYKRKN